jgi:GNAT superfamily N-acetyltransferase
MDPRALSLKMRRLQSWLQSNEPNATRVRHQFDQPPFGHAEVTIDATSTAPAASFNGNRIYLCGCEGGLTRDGLNQMIGLFAAQRVSRFFVWLSPGSGMERVREWLNESRFVKVPWTRYPTLAYCSESVVPISTDLEIRPVGRAAVAAARAQLGDIMMDGYAESVGWQGFHHYMAFDANRPVAVAALVQFEDVGYLTYAGTAESDRRRGAQSALIAHRVEQALALGCTQIVSQTLTMLKESFANLQRAGFREVYEQEVYESPPIVAAAIEGGPR